MNTIKLFRLMGVNVYANWSLLIFAGIIVDWTGGMGMLVSMLKVPMMLGLILVHEYGHILTARRYGIGCESINLNFFGGVALIEGDMDALSPWKQILIILFGPLTNLFFAVGCMFLDYDWMWMIEHSAELSYFDGLLLYFMIVNWSMVIFNMIPVFPLDGGRILRSILQMSGIEGYDRVSRICSYVVGGLFAVLFALIGLWSGSLIMLIIIGINGYEYYQKIKYGKLQGGF